MHDRKEPEKEPILFDYLIRGATGGILLLMSLSFLLWLLD